jgi:hypothetical protein
MSAKTLPNKPPGVVRGVRDTETEFIARRHLRIGWWSLLVFLSLGILLESLHGLKIGWYLNVSNSTRRLMFTLAHAHGTLLALVHIAFAMTIPQASNWHPNYLRVGANCLIGAGVLIPAGFFLGGLFTYAGDPGLGIVLVPVGALFLFIAVFLTARAVARSKPIT